MRKYELIEAMTFRGGRFLLTDEQFKRRRYVVNVIEGNLVEPRSEISFKRGEIVCTDADIPKALERKMLPMAEAATLGEDVPDALDAVVESDPETDAGLDLDDLDPSDPQEQERPASQQPPRFGGKKGKRW